MKEVEEMFKKTSHSAKVFVMWLDPEAEAGTTEAFPWFAFAHTRERVGAERKPDKNGKRRDPYIRKEALSAAGGKVEPTDYKNIPEDPAEFKNYAFRNAAQREVRGEMGIIVPIKSFSEKWSIHVPPVESDHKGSDYLETHYYLIFLKTTEQHVSIVETDEVIELVWCRLDNIPLPHSKKPIIPTFPSHIAILGAFLQKLETKFEDADLWIKTYNARFGSFPL